MTHLIITLEIKHIKETQISISLENNHIKELTHLFISLEINHIVDSSFYNTGDKPYKRVDSVFITLEISQIKELTQFL